MKNYLVVGGSSGIGLSICRQLAGNGHRIWATYYKKEAPSTGQIQYFHLNTLEDNPDLSFLPDVLDGLAYCPGSIVLKPFNRIKPEEFIQDYQLQLVGAAKVIQQALPALKKAEQASIVLFSTVAVQTGFPFHALVSASKGAIEGLSKALAAELAPKIRVNAIAPSLTDTPLASSLLSSDEKKEANAQRHPLKKIGRPEDVANLASFLLTEPSGWISGQIFHIDGGISTLK